MSTYRLRFWLIRRLAGRNATSVAIGAHSERSLMVRQP